MNNKKWILTAQNKSGAAVIFTGNTKISVIRQFNNEYDRLSFTITITNSSL